MKITPQEIDNIEEIGMLDGSPVKLLRTKGGFHIATGKSKNKQIEEALAAGSHPAIVKYNLEKQYPGFQPILLKSENTTVNSVVSNHSNHLSEELKKSGHDIYSVQTGKNIEFQITKQDVRIGNAVGVLKDNSLTVLRDINIPKEFSSALAGAIAEKAIACGTSKVEIQGK